MFCPKRCNFTVPIVYIVPCPIPRNLVTAFLSKVKSALKFFCLIKFIVHPVSIKNDDVFDRSFEVTEIVVNLYLFGSLMIEIRMADRRSVEFLLKNLLDVVQI